MLTGVLSDYDSGHVGDLRETLHQKGVLGEDWKCFGVVYMRDKIEESASDILLKGCFKKGSKYYNVIGIRNEIEGSVFDISPKGWLAKD
ncbi:hypothetical protein CDAR_447701 [Caerostris darwini]|uniref:Uncharacterized protein n=1 Tax=Caerostris darwini TaxID=1538125 RepID=A0AAV4PT16_9ARAC|nr:hypothetical protein CDAR_447701 [Caerostris darwini]